MKKIQFYIMSMLLCAAPLTSAYAMDPADEPMDVESLQTASAGKNVKTPDQGGSHKRKREEGGIPMAGKKIRSQTSDPVSSSKAVYVHELSTLPSDVKIKILGFCDIKSFYRMGFVSSGFYGISKDPHLHLPQARTRKSPLIEWIITETKTEPTSNKSSLESHFDFLVRLSLLNTHIKDSDQQFHQAFLSYFNDVTKENRLFSFDEVINSSPSFKEFLAAHKVILELAEKQGTTTALTPEQQSFQKKLGEWKPYAIALKIAQMLCNTEAYLTWQKFEEAGNQHSLFKDFILYPQLGNSYPHPPPVKDSLALKLTLFNFANDLADMETLKAYHMRNRMRLHQVATNNCLQCYIPTYPDIQALEATLPSVDTEESYPIRLTITTKLEQYAHKVHHQISKQVNSKSERFNIISAYPLIWQLEGIHSKVRVHYETIKKRDIDTALSAFELDKAEGVALSKKALESFYNKLRTLPGYTVTFHDMDKLTSDYMSAAKFLDKFIHLVEVGTFYEEAIKQYNKMLALLGGAATPDQIGSAGNVYCAAAYCIEESDPVRAGALYEEAVKQYNKMLDLLGNAATPEQIRGAAIAYNNAATCIGENNPGRAGALYEEAVKQYNKMLDLLGDAATPEQIRSAVIAYNNAATCIGESDPVRAGALYEEAGKLYKKQLTLLGDKATPDLIGNAGNAYCAAAHCIKKNDPVKASTFFEEAGKLYKKQLALLGDTATQDQKETAVRAYVGAALTRIQRSGPGILNSYPDEVNYPAEVTALFLEGAKTWNKKLAFSGELTTQDQIEEAAASYEQVASDFEGDTLSGVLYEEAGKLYNKLLTLLGEKATPDQIEKAACAYHSAAAVSVDGDDNSRGFALYEEARKLYSRLLTCLGKEATRDQIERAADVCRLAACCISEMNPVREDELYEEAGKLYKKQLTLLGDKATPDLIGNAGNAYCAAAHCIKKNDPVKASTFFEEAGKLYKKQLALLGDTATQDQIGGAADAYDKAASCIEKRDSVKASALYEEAGNLHKKRFSLLGKAAAPHQIESAVFAYRIAANCIAKSNPPKASALYEEAGRLYSQIVEFYPLKNLGAATLNSCVRAAPLYSKAAQLIKGSDPDKAGILYGKVEKLSNKALSVLEDVVPKPSIQNIAAIYRLLADGLKENNPIKAKALSEKAEEAEKLDNKGDSMHLGNAPTAG